MNNQNGLPQGFEIVETKGGWMRIGKIEEKPVMRLKDFRVKAGLTQKQLAQKMEISQATINLWENKKFEPSLRHIIKLAEILGADIAILVKAMAI